MNKQFLLILVLCAGVLSTRAQQRAQSSFDHVNLFNLNHAVAGFDSCIHVFGQQKSQWMGVDGAPRNFQLQGHMPIGADMGVGANISNWSAGLLNRTDIEATIAKHVTLNNGYVISGAASLGYAQHSFGADDVVAFDNDNYLGQSRISQGGLYGDLGLMFTGADIRAGLSVPNVFATAPDLGANGEANEFNPTRYLQLHGAYDYQFDEDVTLSPMVIYRSIPGDGAITDVKVGGRYRDVLGLNLGYRTRNGLLVAVDYLLLDRYTLGYAYDAGFSQLNGISSGSHEFLIGFRMCKPKKQEPEIIDYYTNGTVTDVATGNVLADRPVKITNTKTGTTQTVMTDSAGFYHAKVDTGASYTITLEDPDYETATKSVNIVPAVTTTTADLPLRHKQSSITGTVMDAKTKAVISGASVILRQGEEELRGSTDSQGRFYFDLPDKVRGDELNYEVVLNKKGYDPFNGTFKKTLQDYATIELDGELPGGLLLNEEKKPEQISEIIDLQPINFELNSAKLTTDATVELDKVVKVLNDNPEMKIEIGAHTDCRGSESGNQRLSQKRAESTLAYIQSRISNPERIDGKGYGETQPLSTCACGDCSKEEHDKNRRTEFRILQD